VLQDGKILNDQEAAGYMTYVSVPFWKWMEDASFA
jgi:hypothetical protein